MNRLKKKPEEPLALLDGRNVAHVIPPGLDHTTKCGLDTLYLPSYGPDALPLPLRPDQARCAQCFDDD